ncbi:MAG TPA: 4Fe-4S binding protein [Spirochaetia bacterium]|nr:4Fe-4S binding protein [Spirochaetia bacterium]
MRLQVVDSERCVGCQLCMFACARRQDEAGLERACLGIHSAGGMEHGFVVVVCRACQDPPCARVCPTDALSVRKTGGVELDEAKCIGCRNCQEACIVKAVLWNKKINKPMICVHCGYCVRYCPHGVLALDKQEVTAHA